MAINLRAAVPRTPTVATTAPAERAPRLRTLPIASRGAPGRGRWSVHSARCAATRRGHSVPERLATAGLAVAVAASAWPGVATGTGLSAPCPLRWLTGVPCPGCGLTTASVALVHADVVTATLANPAILGLAGLTLVTLPLLALRRLGVIAPPTPWSPRWRRATARVLVLLALASWLYQLNRLGVR